MSIKEIIQEFVTNIDEVDKNLNNEIRELKDEINFLKVEENLGFSLHKELKEFFSSFYFCEIQGVILPNQIKSTDKWGNWFEFEEQNKKIIVTLEGIESKAVDIEDYIKNSFECWTGGYDFGRRISIGNIYGSRGEILLVFNNDNGKVEWIDCEWGCFGNLNEDPNGVLADSLYDLINLLNENIKNNTII
ncbi:hypothetical protein SAMN02745163_01869 [Clostridium cavendishii DSM 21758]|uniref:SMI1 / KNR4 family (SUKH-1) n=1 Tax=Clostridium cavendishii DSM 21758 TaxID=1121302 RepID=A0A1M6J054_9CLOT|nr:hypothetical protein [Clostridium cavendishii]SHJ39982.1 hypothetical protein SAMN02745163_01869 [Clostridium cavendishii DSM 21758]